MLDRPEAEATAEEAVQSTIADEALPEHRQALDISGRLHAGTVTVNTVDALSAMTPFGDMKESGFGRDLSLHTFDKYTALKTIWIKYRTLTVQPLDRNP